MLVGRYVYHRLTKKGRAELRRAMRRADGRDEYDDLYCGLGNLGYGVSKPKTEDDLIQFLDLVADIRLEATCRSSFMRIICGIAEAGGERRLVALYEDATGIPDDEVFDEVAFPEDDPEWTVVQVLRDLFQRQRIELRRRGCPMLPHNPAHARPGLHRLAPDDPAFNEPKQLMLPNLPHRRLP